MGKNSGKRLCMGFKMQEYKDLITILRKGKDFELLEPFRFYFQKERLAHFAYGLNDFIGYSSLNGTPFIQIPKGFKTDFGSVPQFFQSLISPVGKPTKAYVLHDYLCQRAKRGELTREVADRVFLEAMRVLGVGRVKRVSIYLSVRAYALTKSLLNL